MTNEEFIVKTASYFIEDVGRQARHPSGGCAYFTRTGNRCAVGVWCNKDEIDKISAEGLICSGYLKLLDHNITIKALQGVSIGLITHMQSWHDSYLGSQFERKIITQILDRYCPENAEMLIDKIYLKAKKGGNKVPVEI